MQSDKKLHSGRSTHHLYIFIVPATAGSNLPSRLPEAVFPNGGRSYPLGRYLFTTF
ncbi:MAG: hypothetical protein H6577_24380 [Lewinellaceae bacterium]|nr:hypothetical protein [Saprospiraceae bacterium]MCB9341273.1 hypothetical protein [Lewinellaceae bacterium]